MTIQIEPGPVSRPARHSDLHAALWFRLESKRGSTVDTGPVDIRSSHYRVCEYPVAELGNSLEDVCDAVIDISYSEYWVGCRRRGVGIGDILVYAGTAYVITDDSDPRANYRPKAWRGLALIEIELKQEPENEKWDTP